MDYSTNLANWGITYGSIWSNDLVQPTNAVYSLGVGTTVYGAVAANDMIFVNLASSTSTLENLCAVRVVSKLTSPNIEPGLCSWPTSATPDRRLLYTNRTAGTPTAWPVSLGNITNIKTTVNSSYDVYSMPFENCYKTEVYDGDATLMRFDVSGYYTDADLYDVVTLKMQLEQLLNGNQADGGRHMFWNNRFTTYSIPRAFPVVVESVTFDDETPSLVGGEYITKYNIRMVVRAYL